MSNIVLQIFKEVSTSKNFSNFKDKSSPSVYINYMNKDFSPLIKSLYSDDELLIVEKPAHLLVHPSKESTDRTTLLKLTRLQYNKFLYPVHRIDRPVSGVVVFALNSNMAKEIQKVWKEEVVKEYIALVFKRTPESGEISRELFSEKKIKQSAITQFKTIYHFNNFSLLRVRIKTGRKHQIRRHLSSSFHHIVGDTMYGKARINQPFRESCQLNRIFLHSYYIKLNHPATKENIAITSMIPIELAKTLFYLGLKDPYKTICEINNF